MKAIFRRVAGWCRRQWNDIRPGPEARQGAVWGVLAPALWCVIIAGLYLRTGFGYTFDFLFAAVFAALAIPLVALTVALLLTIARKLPRFATGLMVGSCVIVALVWSPPELGAATAVILGVTEGVLGATIATFIAGRFAQAALSKKIVTVTLCALAVAANVWFAWFLLEDGSDG